MLWNSAPYSAWAGSKLGRVLGLTFALSALLIAARIYTPHDELAAPSHVAPQHVAPQQDAATLRRPRALKRGDTIMFVAPAGSVDRDKLRRARNELEARGYRVTERKDLYEREGYLAGDDSRRADEIMQAFSNDKVDAVFCGAGGYGVTRILDVLDWDLIAKNPKMLIGFSDITALHIAMQQKAGVISFHGPVAESSVGSSRGMTPFTESSLFDTLEHRAFSGKKNAARRKNGYLIAAPTGDDADRIDALGKGRARGRLVGGNLSLVVALMGTPYELDTRDAVLFLEDVGESAYRIDRMLTQLRQAGKLATLKGAVIGKFTRSNRREAARSSDQRYSVNGVLESFFKPLNIPVLTNFPAGHHRQNATLPMGAEVEVDAKRRRLRILAPPVGL